MSHRASTPPRGVTALIRALAHLLTVGLLCAATLATAQPVPAPYGEVSRLMRAGEAIKAEQLARRYIEQNPRDPQMRFLLGVAQNQQGNVADAQETFTRLTQEFPELPEPHNNLAVIHAAAGRYDEARVALEAALRANPRYAVALENLGDVHARLAQRAWQASQQIDATNARLAPKLKAVQGLFDTPASAGKP